MINKIVPEISNGRARLLVSETFCFMPRHGLRIAIPTASGTTGEVGTIGITFTFSELAGGGLGMVVSVNGSEVLIALSNFGQAFPAGLTAPININIDGRPVSILFSGTGLANAQNPRDKVVTLTVSVFQGDLNE